MKNFSALLFLCLASGLLFNQTVAAQTCSGSYGASYYPASSSCSVSNRSFTTPASFQSYANYGPIQSSHRYGVIELPKKQYPGSFQTPQSSWVYQSVSTGTSSTPVSSFLPAGSYAPGHSNYYVPSSNYIPGQIMSAPFQSSAPPTCSNGTCRFN